MHAVEVMYMDVESEDKSSLNPTRMLLIFPVAQAREQGCRGRKGLPREGQDWNALHFLGGWGIHLLGDGGCVMVTISHLGIC